MSYRLPCPLLRHIEEDLLKNGLLKGEVHWLNLTTYSIETLRHLRAFSARTAQDPDEPYEETSRQEVSFYDAEGYEIGSVAQERRFSHAWSCSPACYEEGGETAGEVLDRLDGGSSVEFVLQTYYLHGKLTNIRVWRV